MLKNILNQLDIDAVLFGSYNTKNENNRSKYQNNVDFFNIYK